jgi:hypothetical protein
MPKIEIKEYEDNKRIMHEDADGPTVVNQGIS